MDNLEEFSTSFTRNFHFLTADINSEGEGEMWFDRSKTIFIMRFAFIFSTMVGYRLILVRYSANSNLVSLGTKLTASCSLFHQYHHYSTRGRMRPRIGIKRKKMHLIVFFSSSYSFAASEIRMKCAYGNCQG